MSSASDAAPEPLPADRFSDRELSWLAFNQRVLELAEDTAVPPLERAKFLAIFASNLDEFYMVRVAGLKRRIAAGIAVQAASGLTPRELMKRVHDRTRSLMSQHAQALRDLMPTLRDGGIQILRWRDLDVDEQKAMGKLFDDQIFAGADAARRRPGAPVPLHLRPFAEPCRRRAQPEHRSRTLRPCQGATDAAALCSTRRR